MEHLIKILNDPKASKDSLRGALAEALGVSVPVFAQAEVLPSLFKACMQHFCQAYQAQTGLSYRFGARDGVALSGIIKQLREVSKGDDTSVLLSFRTMVDNLPEWYRRNQFNLPVIDRKFNDIVLSIKNKKDGNNAVSNEYKRRVLGDLLA